MSITDQPIAWLARRWLNSKLRKIGCMSKLSIDSARKTVTVELDLEGEVTPITLTIENYRVIPGQGETFLEVGTVTTSRKWLTDLCADHLNQRRVNLTQLGLPRLVIGML
jgi:hypothetical protein